MENWPKMFSHWPIDIVVSNLKMDIFLPELRAYIIALPAAAD